jgi:hypothetical protein
MTILLTSTPGLSQVYVPFSWCPEYQIKFETLPAPAVGFKLLIPEKTNSTSLVDSNIRLERKSDLLSVEWKLKDQVEQFCPQVIPECMERIDPPIDAEFFSNIQEVLNYLPKQNRCDEVADLITLQNEIEGLGKKNLFTYKKPIRARNIFKTFAPDSKELIDLFSVCGGKKGSGDFVKNAILIELSSACMIPKPPGSFTWEEAEVIAAEIGQDYKEKSLLSIYKSENEISNVTIKRFARELIRKEAKDYVPEVDKFIDKLPYWDSFDENLKTEGYLDHLMSLDATFSVVEGMLPYIIEGQFKDRVPNGDTAIMADIQKRAKAEYDKCVQPYKNKMRFESPIKKRIEGIKEVHQDLCLKPGISCAKNACESDPILSETKGVADSDVLKSCIYSSLSQALNPIIQLTVKGSITKEEDKRVVSEDIANKGIIRLKECLNEKYPGYNSERPNASLSLVRPGAPDFEESFLSCVEVMTAKVGRETSGYLVKENIKDYYPSNFEITSEEILSRAYDPCIRAMPEEKKDPARCEYLITVNSVESVIKAKFNKDYPEQRKKNDQIISSFKECMAPSIESFYKNINVEGVGGSEYTAQDMSLSKCTSTAIEKFAGSVAYTSYKEKVEELGKKGDLEYQKEILKFSSDIQLSVENCFKKELESYKTWDSLSSLMDDDQKFSSIQTKCENLATARAIGTIFNYEAKGQIKEYKTDGVFASTVTPELILDEVTGILVTNYNLKVPSNLKGDERRKWIYQEGYLKYINKYPKLKDPVASYTDYLEKIATDSSYQKVHENLFSKMSKINSSITAELKPNFSPDCFHRMYEVFLSKLPKNPNEPPSIDPLKDLAETLMNGLSYVKKVDQVTYKSKLAAIKNYCDSQFDYQQSKNSVIVELMLKGQVFEGIEEDFSKALLQGIAEEKKKIADPNKDVKLKYVQYKYDKMKALIDKKLRNPKELEKILYSDGSLLNYGQATFDKLASGDKETKEIFTELMLRELFSDTSNNSFASEFAEIQLVSSIGQVGVTDAIKTASESWASTWNSVPETAAKDYFSSPINIEKALNWNAVAQKDKQSFISDIVNYGVLPKAKLSSFDGDSMKDLIVKSKVSSISINKSFLITTAAKSVAEEKLQEEIQKSSKNAISRLKNKALSGGLSHDMLMSEFTKEANSYVAKNFNSLSAGKKEEMKSYLISAMMEEVVATKGEGLVRSNNVEDRIANRIQEIVKSRFLP